MLKVCSNIQYQYFIIQFQSFNIEKMSSDIQYLYLFRPNYFWNNLFLLKDRVKPQKS
jgi:hypothetical protein